MNRKWPAVATGWALCYLLAVVVFWARSCKMRGRRAFLVRVWGNTVPAPGRCHCSCLLDAAAGGSTACAGQAASKDGGCPGGLKNLSQALVAAACCTEKIEAKVT